MIAWITVPTLGSSGRVMSNAPAIGPVATPSLVMPNLASVFGTV